MPREPVMVLKNIGLHLFLDRRPVVLVRNQVQRFIKTGRRPKGWEALGSEVVGLAASLRSNQGRHQRVKRDYSDAFTAESNLMNLVSRLWVAETGIDIVRSRWTLIVAILRAKGVLDQVSVPIPEPETAPKKSSKKKPPAVARRKTAG